MGIGLITYTKKMLDSDWLGAVQFKGNTSAKSVTPVQITAKVSKVSPRKPGDPNDFQGSSGVFQKLSKLTRRLPKITEECRRSPEDFRIYSKITKIGENHPKRITEDCRRLPKDFRDF